MAEIRRVLGKTHLIEVGMMSIPFYDLGEGRIILMDSGINMYGEEISVLLAKNGLKVVAILTSHVHFDHVGNHNRFQAKSGAEVWASIFDAAVMQSAITVQAVLYNHTGKNIKEKYNYMICKVDHVFEKEQS